MGTASPCEMLCHNISALYGRLKDTASPAPGAAEQPSSADEQLSKPAKVSTCEKEREINNSKNIQLPTSLQKSAPWTVD